MLKTLTILVSSVFLVSCSSSGDLVEGSEEYEGPRTAAIAPVADRRSAGSDADGRYQADIQHSIQRQLDQSGIFAGVVSLNRPDEGNEAEVIIEPALVGPGGYGDDVELRVRVTEKTSRRTVLARTYEGSGGQPKALNVAASELEEDLANHYR